MKKAIIILLPIFLLSSCGGGEFKKTPVDELILKMDQDKNFTIILYDMNVEGTFSKDYFHKYKVIREKEDGSPYEEVYDWMEVSEDFFTYHSNDLGMEVASKKDGVVSKQVSPPGYNNYVGNTRYGTWRTDSSGNSFWEFYGKYAFMSSMIGLVAGPVYRSSYYDYYNNYRGVRPYYGSMTTSGSYRYGTFSQASRTQNPSFHQRAQTSSVLKNTVNNKIERSSSRTSRSSSRYSTGTSSSSSSSSRSRSMSRGGK